MPNSHSGPPVIAFASVPLFLFLTATASWANDLGEYDKLPPNVASWAYFEFQGVPLERAYYSAKIFDYSGQQLHRIKAERSADHKLIDAVFDKNGVVQPDRGAQIVRAENKAYYQINGAVKPTLASKLAGAKDSDVFDVVIWLRTLEPVADKEDLLADSPAMAADEAAREAIHAGARNKLMRDWANFTEAPIEFDPGAPIAMASLKKSDIWAIAKHPAIARIYSDEPSMPLGTSW